MEEELKKGKPNFSEYYVREKFKEVLKEAYQYKKAAKKAYFFVLLIAVGTAVVLGLILGVISKGNIFGYIIGRNNRTSGWYFHF